MYSATVEKSEEDKGRLTPQTLQNMVDAFNALNQVLQQILMDASKYADEVCFRGGVNISLRL